MTAIVEIRKNPMSLLFLVLSAAVFGVAQLTDPENVRFLAFDAAELPQRWYAILTYGFVHVEWNHIIVNMLLLVWIGVWVEWLIGSRKVRLTRVERDPCGRVEPVVLLILSITAIAFGWLPSVGHVPHLAGAFMGLVFLSLFRRVHRPIEEALGETP